MDDYEALQKKLMNALKRNIALMETNMDMKMKIDAVRRGDIQQCNIYATLDCLEIQLHAIREVLRK